jgi:hypothetical protein
MQKIKIIKKLNNVINLKFNAFNKHKLWLRLNENKKKHFSYSKFLIRKLKKRSFNLISNLKILSSRIRKKNGAEVFSLEKYAFHLSKHESLYLKKLNIISSKFSFQLVNPIVTVLELKQFAHLVLELTRFKRHKLFIFIENSQLRKLFEKLIKYFPYLTKRVSIERTSSLQRLDPTYKQSSSGIVLLLGKVPEFVQNFFISKNFLVINGINLDSSYKVDHYKITGDVKNIKSITWLLSFLNAIYKRTDANLVRMKSFLFRSSNLQKLGKKQVLFKRLDPSYAYLRENYKRNFFQKKPSIFLRKHKKHFKNDNISKPLNVTRIINKITKKD